MNKILKRLLTETTVIESKNKKTMNVSLDKALKYMREKEDRERIRKELYDSLDELDRI